MATKPPRPPEHGGSHSFSEEPPSDRREEIAAVVEVRDIARMDDGVRDLVGGAA